MNDSRRTTSHARRRALGWGHVNGALWSIGNGLTTGTLIVYLALDMGARGASIGLILATPYLVGLLRMGAPLLIRRFGTAKAMCLSLSLASYLLLTLLPALAFVAPDWKFSNYSDALPLLIGVLCVHQLLEYLGVVAFWSWMADLVPRRIRGRYFGRRQIWQLAVLIPTLLASGGFTDWWRAAFPDAVTIAYAIPTALGVVFLLLSLLPLAAMPATQYVSSESAPIWRTLLSPLADARFRRLLLFGCWFSFFNGVTQTPQNIYPKEVLGFGVLALVVMRTTMRVGQLGASAWVGPFSDRYGNRPTLIVSQLLVAAGPLFFLWATPAQPWWLTGAWIVWSAYAGLNICLPNLMLKLSPERDNSAYIAAYFALTGVLHAVSTVAGGWLFDVLSTQRGVYPVGPFQFDLYEYYFWIGWVTRTLGVLLLVRIIEPGAWRWRDIIVGDRRAARRYLSRAWQRRMRNKKTT